MCVYQSIYVYILGKAMVILIQSLQMYVSSFHRYHKIIKYKQWNKSTYKQSAETYFNNARCELSFPSLSLRKRHV